MKPAGGKGEPLTSSSRCLSCYVCMQPPCVCIPLYAVHACTLSLHAAGLCSSVVRHAVRVGGGRLLGMLRLPCQSIITGHAMCKQLPDWHVTDVQTSADCQLRRWGLTVMRFMHTGVVAGCNMCCIAAGALSCFVLFERQGLHLECWRVHFRLCCFNMRWGVM